MPLERRINAHLPGCAVRLDGVIVATAWTLFAAATAMAALATWILVLKFNSSVNRAFAVYLYISAIAIVLNALTKVCAPGSACDPDYMSRVRVYLHLAQVPALAYFGTTYLAWRGGRRLILARSLIVLAGAGILLAHALLPCLNQCNGGDLGPFALLSQSPALMIAILAVCIASDWLRRGAQPGSSATMMLALAFTVDALYSGSVYVAGLYRLAGGPFWNLLIVPWRVLPAVVALPAVVLFVVGWKRGLLRDVQMGVAAAYAGFALVCGLALAAIPTAPTTAFGAVFQMGLPVLSAYALVRHRLFGIEARVRQALGRVILAVALLFVAFGLAWAADGIWAGAGTYVGWGVAVLLALAISPLDQLGQRLARALMPDARATAEMSVEERLDVYRDRITTILTDGRMAVHDRVVLDRLRDTLMLPSGWATRIEREAWAKVSMRKGAGTRPPWVDPPQAENPG